VIKQKVRMIIAVLAAIVVGFLVLTVTYIIFPNEKPGQPPNGTPTPDMLNQIFSALLWIGLAALIASTIVGAIFLVNKFRKKKTKKR
jgi:hypothetical protein